MHLKHIRTTALAGAFLCLASIGCSPRGNAAAPNAAAETAADATPRPAPTNLVFILIDTLRADHVGAYGYERPTTPNLDRFLERATVFTNSRSQASCTFPSVNSLLTSRHPLEFIGRGALPAKPDTKEVTTYWQSGNRPAQFGIPEDIRAIPEILQDAGFHTLAVSASPIVRSAESTEATNRWGGFGRGFEIFDEECLNRKADCVNRTALPLLLDRPTDRPFFAYLHYMDPHAPYGAPEAFGKPFSGKYSGKPYIENGIPYPIEKLINRGKTHRITDADLGHLIDLYDDGIAYFDHHFGQLVEFLESSGILQDTLVVIFSDHGESFLDHSTIAHCHSVFDSEVRVPLAFYVPGAEDGQRLSLAAQNLDIVPTALSYLQVETPLPFAGRNLRNLIDGRASGAAAEEHLVFSAQRAWRSVNNRDRKLIYDLASGDYFFFDTTADPDEEHNLAQQEPGRLRTLSGPLLQHMLATEGSVDPQESLEQSQAIEDRLRALGYFD